LAAKKRKGAGGADVQFFGMSAPLPALLMWLLLWGGCGGRGGSPPPVGGTPPGTYTITLTATSGSLTYSAPFTVTV
jgi:hypothetical protein